LEAVWHQKCKNESPDVEAVSALPNELESLRKAGTVLSRFLTHEMGLHWKCLPPCLKKEKNPFLALRPSKDGVIQLVRGNATGFIT
jgi:hypothetical protein